MALTVELETDENGRPRLHYRSDGTSPVVYTGPISGTVTVGDGTIYDVTEPFIEVAPGHEGEVSHAIGVRHEAEGHPEHTDGEPFVHVCDDGCGALKREI